ncbi:unnamed protein product, partial [Closterium sp. Yama58-4]
MVTHISVRFYRISVRWYRISVRCASGAVDTAGGAITAESAPSVAQRGARDEQGRRRELVSKSSCDKARNRDCSISVFLFIKRNMNQREQNVCENARANTIRECDSWGY